MAEIGRCRGKRPLDLATSAIQQLLARPWRCTRARLQGRPSGFRVITKADLAGYGAPLVLDPGQLLDADPMQIAGVQVQRGPGADLGLVQLRSVGRRPQTRFRPRGLAVRAQQRLEKGSVSYTHLRAHET